MSDAGVRLDEPEIKLRRLPRMVYSLTYQLLRFLSDEFEVETEAGASVDMTAAPFEVLKVDSGCLPGALDLLRDVCEIVPGRVCCVIHGIRTVESNRNACFEEALKGFWAVIGSGKERGRKVLFTTAVQWIFLRWGRRLLLRDLRNLDGGRGGDLVRLSMDRSLSTFLAYLLLFCLHA